VGDTPPTQIFIARVRQGLPVPKSERITITDATFSDDKPQFSADGNRVVFTSTRNGYLCVWVQRLEPESKHPAGAPLAVEHFHNSDGQHGTAAGSKCRLDDQYAVVCRPGNPSFAATYIFLAIKGARRTQDFVLALYQTSQFTFDKLAPWLREYIVLNK
jgi:hypothetical protein